jgi:DNA repair exonuclease SbcCD nuclease subunit
MICDNLLVLGDIHIGARNSSKIFRQLFREYFKDIVFPLVKDRGIKTIVQLGDFFDNRNNLSLSDIDYVLTEFLKQLEDSGAHMYVLAGNHDVAYKNTNKINSLSILNTSPNVTTIDNELYVIRTDSKNFVLCPWINNENEEQLVEDMKHYATNDHILCGHFEFQGMKMYKNSIVSEHGFKPSQFSKFYKVISGHFHHPSTYGNVSYMGSVFHLNWQDHGDKKFIYVFDTKTDEFEAIENPYSLFTEFDYHGDSILDMKDEDFQEMCNGQFVKIVIDSKYNRVDLKDLIYRIEKTKPISVDVVDNTILCLPKGIDSDIIVSETKELNDYLEEYLEEHEMKSTLIDMFNQVKQEAEQNMKEFE